MKYTSYILNKKIVEVDRIYSRNLLVNVLLSTMKIPVILMAVVFISGLLPMTLGVDSFRNLKCRLIHFQRKGYRF